MCIRDRAKTDLEITLEGAKRFGFEQYFNEDPEVDIKRVLEPTGVTYDELVEKKGVNMWEMCIRDRPKSDATAMAKNVYTWMPSDDRFTNLLPQTVSK